MSAAAAMAIGPIIKMLGGVAGYYASEGDRDRVGGLINANLAAALGISLPELEKLVAEQLGPSAMEGVSTDPRLAQAQYSALDKLGEVVDGGGLTLADKANLNKLLGRASQTATAGRKAISNDMAARGMGGSGAELAAMLFNNQASADQAGTAALDIAGTAQQRALDAMMGRAQVAGGMRSQEWGEKSQTAQAKDLISRYNADARTQANHYNAQIPQQQFNNQMQQYQTQASARANSAQHYQNEANAKAAAWTGGAGAVGDGFSAVGAYQAKQQNGPNPNDPNDPRNKFGA